MNMLAELYVSWIDGSQFETFVLAHVAPLCIEPEDEILAMARAVVSGEA